MTSALITRTEPAKPRVVAAPRRRRSSCVGVATFAGILAFALAVLNNIVLSDAASRQIFDSCHYIQTSRELYLWAQDLMLGTNASVGKETLGSMMLIDGPILPVCGALSSAIFGCAPSVATSHFLMIFQAAMHAITAALVVVLGHAWLRSRLYLSAFAGILWAVYPGALAGSGMFLTEPLTTALVMVLVWLSTKTQSQGASITNTALGFTVACIALLKPPLLPLVAALLLLRWMTQRKARVLPTLLAFAAGLVIVFAPWIAFTKYATGKAQVLPQRVPSVNLAVGNDVEFDGWHTLPLPPLTMLEILQPPAQIIASLGRAHGTELVALTLRKFTRLWAQPWIPSQRDILGVPYAFLGVIHQLLLALSIPAVLYVIATTKLTPKLSKLPRRRLLSTALCLVLFVHLLYLPFETVARYALSAMPALITILVCASAEMLRRKSMRLATIFGITSAIAMFGCWQTDLFALLSGWIPNAGTIALIGSAISLALFLTVLAATWTQATIGTIKAQKIRLAKSLAVVGILASGIAFANVEPGVALPEWKTHLDKQAAVRTISAAPKIDWNNVAGAYVLIDSDKNIADAEVTVNGVLAAVPARAHEVCDFQYKHTVDEFLAICANCRDLQPEDMRNWWLAPVEIEKLANQAGPIELKVAARKSAPVTVYGQYLREGQKELLIPHLHYLGFSKLEASRDRIEYRQTDKFHRRATKSTSELQEAAQSANQAKWQIDLSTEPGTQTGEYRIYLLIAYKVPQSIVDGHADGTWLYPDHQIWSIW